MTNKAKKWLSATRPRTLFLSIAGILLGGLIAPPNAFNLTTWLFCALTAAGLQILSNLANDYGDFMKGADNELRQGPQRAMQSGAINANSMKKAILITALITLALGGTLVLITAKLNLIEIICFATIGTGAIAAALLYTLGKHPYGYRGLGDLYCFLFFGIASVSGTHYLMTHHFDYTVLLPAAAIGLMANAVLNINNMRDAENDKRNGKMSLAVKIGTKNAFIYHTALITSALLLLTTYLILNHKSPWCYTFLLLTPLFVTDLYKIQNTEPQALDPFLKKQSVKTFVLALTFGLLTLI